MRGSRRLLIAVLAGALLAPAAPALAHHRPGPCDVHQREDETVQGQMRRIIRCAVERWEVPGGADKAVCIAAAESGLNPEAVSANGEYLGLYQHMAEAWPDRYREWTRPAWELSEDALSGRTNAIVTIRMVSENGWGPWSGVGDC
ncbi:MAG TPA: hypothetical protein VFK59_10215 [Actinomycetota bacterium]|nr:hypothetical protein [Actinomycetota bacterium]